MLIPLLGSHFVSLLLIIELNIETGRNIVSFASLPWWSSEYLLSFVATKAGCHNLLNCGIYRVNQNNAYAHQEKKKNVLK